MSSSVRTSRGLAAGLAAALAVVPLAAQGRRALPAPGDAPPGLAARVRAAVAAGWRADTAGLVVSWGTGSLRTVPDSAPFRLLGPGEEGWFVLLVEPVARTPMAVRIRAGHHLLRPVAARPLRAGSRLEEGDLRWEPWTRWGPPPDNEAAAAETGWLVRRALRAGDPLEGPRVMPPPLVISGQPVRLVWSRGAVSLTLAGVALNDAALGESVRVRTRGRMGVVRATASGPDEARM